MKLILSLIKFTLQFVIGVRNINYYGALVSVPEGLDWKTRLQIYSRRYERAEIDAIMHYLHDSETLLEIGGGAGILASVIDVNCNPKKHIIYEAIDTNFSRIKDQKLLSSTEVHNFAVVSSSSNEKTLKFRVRDRVFGSGFLSEGTSSVGTDKFIDVPTIAIDEVLDADYDVVLMDVEGYEEFLLPELASSSNAIIIFEYHNDKCQMALSDLFALCPDYTFTHFSDSTFVGTHNLVSK